MSDVEKFAGTYIKFDVQQHIHSVGGYDPEDSWSRDSTDGYVEIRSAWAVENDGYHVLATTEALTAGATVFLVWAQYSTGDSFGSDGGQCELLEVLTSEAEAASRAEFYRSVTDYSVPWNGYFEDLDFVKVEQFTLDAP